MKVSEIIAEQQKAANGNANKDIWGGIIYNVKVYGATGDGKRDDTASIQAAFAAMVANGGGVLYFPPGKYVLKSGFVVNNTMWDHTFPYEGSIIFEGAGPEASVIMWKYGGDGRTGTCIDWGQGVYGGVYNLQFITGADEGHSSQVIDGYTTITTPLAGCDSTSSVAIKHKYNGSFTISNCDFQRWHYAIQMNLGYNRAIRDISIMFCNVGIGNYDASTINHYLNSRVERCAVGLSFALSSTHTVESVVSEANYAGCDVLIGPNTHSLHFLRCYFEASPKQVVILGGSGTTIGAGMPSGHVFEQCNSISITSQGNIGDIYMIKGICGAVPIEHAGTGVATYYAIDCYQHTGDPQTRAPATGYIMGAKAKLYEQSPTKFSVPGHMGVATNSPAGSMFYNYMTVGSLLYPALSLVSSQIGGRWYSIAQDIISGNGTMVFADETASVYRMMLDHLGVLKPGVDNTQSLGSASNRWSTVYAGTGTINTSDENTKQDIEAIPQSWLDAWGSVEYMRYKFNDAVAVKGNNARWHVGLIAQRVKEAFESRGINPFEIGLLCYDEWEQETADVLEDVLDEFENHTDEKRPRGEKRIVTEAGQRYGIRYEEALALECAYLRSRLA